MSISYTLTDSSITILDEASFEPRTMPSSHPAFKELIEAVANDNKEEVRKIMDLPAVIADFTQGKISVLDRVLYLNGRPLDTSATRRVLQFMDEGRPELAKPLCNFIEKVSQNPSRRAVYGLYEWAERSGLPITPDGDIIAWKIVKDNFLDIYTGTFDNSVGAVVEVPRNEVDEDPDQTCSYGLHVCSTGYLPHYGTGSGSRVMVVRVDPKDFVAVPRDYDCAKARVCRYTVIAEMPREKAKTYLRDQFVYEPKFNNSGYRTDSPLNCDAEVGEYYRTRDGHIVEIQRYDDEGGDYPFRGRIVNGDGVEYSWSYDGVYTDLEDEHELDLVEHLDDFDPDFEEPVAPKKRHWFSRIVFGE